MGTHIARKTKIIVTLGPATEKEETLRKLIASGVNVFRLNMSHATHDWIRPIIELIRKLSLEMLTPIGILLDTQGPAIRTGDLPTKLDLKVGDTFTFTLRGQRREGPYSVDTNYDDLINDINIGDVVLVDNGVIRMVVKAKDARRLQCEVLTEGSLGSRRHINLPGVRVNLPALTKKDLADINVGLACGVDFIALSFVREANDITLLRQILASKGKENVSIIAKIEDQSAVRNINEIIAETDVVMVARGDLGIECPYEELPIIQRKIVKKCILAGKPVIVATHMLESMIQNPMPTRAEITDIANAVFEQTDAIMLSGETSVGRYPVECVNVFTRVAERIEQSGNLGLHKEIILQNDKQIIASSAIALADKVKAQGICVFTHSGRMAAICASLRSRWSPIFAFTPNADLINKLTLRYAIRAFHLIFHENPEDNIIEAKNLLQKRGFVEAGGKLVIISDVLTWGEPVSSVQLRLVG